MYSLLLVVIYAAFISLGLPDALLGSAWPGIYQEFSVPVSAAGIVTFIISCGTVISSLLSDRLTHRFGAGPVTAVSVLLTAAALAGFSFSTRFWMLCVWAIPYGLGAGAVDAALNNFVALHYAARHMHWLHCFWALGVTVSPCIMSSCLSHSLPWQNGYRIVSLIQFALTAGLFLSLPFWKRIGGTPAAAQKQDVPHLGITGVVKLPGVPLVLLGFLCYCALEATTFLWSCSYLALGRNWEHTAAVHGGALLFFGILAGRFTSGIFTKYFDDRALIRIGIALTFAGIALLLLPWRFTAPAGLFIIGCGCAPVYPAIIHATPANFGAENSQAIIGIQMASAYIGSTLTPPCFGVLAQYTTMKIFPFFLLFWGGLLIVLLERMFYVVKTNRQKEDPSWKK